MVGGGEKAFQYDRAAQQKPNRLVRDRCGERKRKPDELSGASIRPKQASNALSRFDLGIDVGRLVHRYDQFVTQTLVISFSVIMNEESADSSARRGLAKENPFVKALAHSFR